MSYFLRLPVYDEQGTLAGFFSSEALKPEQLVYYTEYVQANPQAFQSVGGNWYHVDPETQDTTHPAHTTD